MCQYFFQIHDPTTLNRQGNDKGTQYASIIYVQDNDFYEVAVEVRERLQKLINAKQIPSSAYSSVRVASVVRIRTHFYEAKKEHQQYLVKHSDGYCNHRERFSEWPSIGAGSETKNSL
jgi:peptide-methionine (S)-S-oxide reductase